MKTKTCHHCKNDFNIMHTHPNCNLSAAYYVKARKNCGKFTIENPKATSSCGCGLSFSV